MKKIFLLILIFVFQLCFISAEENYSENFDEKNIFTFEDLKQYLNLNNPEIQKLQQEYDRSLLDIKDAKANYQPTVDLQLMGTYMFNPPIGEISINVDEIIDSIKWPSGINIPKTGNDKPIKVYDGMDKTLYYASLSVMQPIWTWGKISNAVKLYTEISDVQLINLSSKKSQMETELESRLVSIFYIKKIKSILDEEKNYVARLLKLTETAAANGMMLKQDVIEAKIKAKEIEMAELDLDDQINSQLVELKRLTGIDFLDFEKIEYQFDENRLSEIMECNRTEVMEKALSGNQSSIKMLSQMKHVRELSQKIAEGTIYWKPDFALQFSLGYGGTKFPFFQNGWKDADDYSANVTLGISTTVWDGGKKLNDIARKKSEVQTAEIDLADAKLQIKHALESQWNTIDLCAMKIEYQDLKIETAQSKINQQELIYKSGYGSETDVLNAKIDLCNQQIEKYKQKISLAVSALTVQHLMK